MFRRRVLFLLVGDLAILAGSYIAAFFFSRRQGYIPEMDLDLFLFLDNGLIEIAAVIATILFGMYFLGLYERIRVQSVPALLQDLLLVFGVAFLIQAIASYSKSNFVLSRWIMLYGSALGGFSLILWRIAYSYEVVRRSGRQGVLFLGDSPLVRRVRDYIAANPESGFAIMGCLHTLSLGANSNRTDGLPGTETGQPISLAETVKKLRPERIAVADSVELDDELRSQLLDCSMVGLNVESIGTIYEEIFGRVAIETVTLNQLVFSPSFRPKPSALLMQEIYGRLIALAGILLTWPLMLLAAIAVRLDSSGPILFRQIRIGRNGVPFVFLKFRSMYADIDKRLGGPVRAKENDPRITRVGRWIRLTRIDELPQFFNVLRGDMTLVGPRPEMPEFEADLVKQIPLYTQRHRVKPGITGWAQIHHVPEDSLENTIRKLEYDLYYIKHLSPALDFFTMFHTAKAILFRIGAR
jgi:exopolysaccharide biosynthesis polyprenyl glycosylphosphotransferase